MEDGMEIPLKTWIKPPYDPAIPLLGIYPEETKIEKKQNKTKQNKTARNLVFIAVLFTIDRTRKQTRCLFPGECIKKLQHINT